GSWIQYARVRLPTWLDDLLHTVHSVTAPVMEPIRRILPNMGGLEAFGQMQQIDPTVPVIICTGYGENEEVQQILSGGGAGLLPKPYRVAQLADALEQVEAKVYTAGLRP
ncbi:MAG: response regulator, partial [Acidobacteria bacterium]|nr:response regulator [Acidobacteriota bacterium]